MPYFAEVGRRVLIDGPQRTETCRGVTALLTADMCAEIFDVNLQSRRVGPEEIQRQTALLDNQHGVVAVAAEQHLS